MSFFIGGISFLACILVLILENYVGIGWDYHPDSQTYIYSGQYVTHVILENGWKSIPNNLYYMIAALCQANIWLLTFINIVLYSWTNVLLSSEFKRFSIKQHINQEQFWLLLFILLFSSYRLHLAVHILKDTLLIFLLCLISTQRGATRYLAWFLLLLTRIFSTVYIIHFINKKYFKWVMLFILFIVFSNLSLVFNFVDTLNSYDLNFREYDSVPNFSSMGELGILIRCIVWPFFVFTGLFILVSPSTLYLPIAISAIIMQFWCVKVVKKWGITTGAYLVMAILATTQTAFTTYIRYCYPLWVVLPLYLMCERQEYDLSRKKLRGMS